MRISTNARARVTITPIVVMLAISTLALSAQQPPQPPSPPTPAKAPSPIPPAAANAPARAPRPAARPELAGQLDGELARALAEVRLQGNSALLGQQANLLKAQSMELAARVAASGVGAMKYFIAGESLGGGQFFGGAPSAPWSSGGGTFLSSAPAPWKADDPADSLYREARKALSNDSYRRAADLFRRIRDQYPKSAYTPDAPYWEAFALQRMGGKVELTAALEALELQGERFPRASTHGDAMALRTRVEGQLARLGDQHAIASLADKARNATSDGCPREQDDERLDALNALAQMDAEQSLPILKKVLARREACTQRLRRQAVWLVASRKQPDAASILMNVAKTDPDKDVREQAVFWMANVPTEEATTMLIELAKKSDDLDLQRRAVYALSRSKSPRAAATLREIALDANGDESLRGDALTWYMSGPGRTADDTFGFLTGVYGRADDNGFKTRVLNVIAQRRNDEARTFLVEVAQNQKESMEIRRSAIYMLQMAGVTNAQITQIYDRGTDLEIRRQLIGVLSMLKDNAGVDKLLDIARNEKNVELRKQAVSSLIRTKDPRALALLQEIVSR